MKTMSRTNFLIAANIVWFAQFLLEWLVVLAPDYTAWWQAQRPGLQLGCYEDAYRYDPAQRLFLYGLIWLLSTPLMTLAAWRLPAQWPAALSRLWWNGADPFVSAISAAGAILLIAWPLNAMVQAPVTSTLLIEGLRGMMLVTILHYYRGVWLSAEPASGPTSG
jgi:hypothetical protein